MNTWREKHREKLEEGFMKYREKGLNDVCLDGAERLVSDDDEDLLLFFQVDEVTKPGFFGKSAEKKKEKEMCFFSSFKFMLFNPVHGECLSSFQQF